MKANELSRAHTVDRPDAGAIFANSRMRRILMMFAREPLSLTEAAAVSSIELKRLHNYVQRLVRVGLLRIHSSRPRAGRPIKLYRAVGSAFFVSNQVLPKPSTDELANELRRLLESDEARGSEGILVTLGESMEPRIEFVLSEERPRRGFELWRILRLQRDEFDRLRGELDAILGRYQRAHDDRGEVYLLHAAGVVRADREGVVDNPKSTTV